MNVAASPVAAEAMVRLEGVRKSFGDNLVLDGIDLSVAPGEVLVVIGPSGSGKSTLLRCVNLLEPIQEGRIYLEGEEITRKGVNVSAIRQRIGIVFQQFNLFPQLTALDNLTLAARRIRKVPRREAEARARELLTSVGLAEKANQHPHQLSGGQQQRVAIARALLKKPSLVLADEPTGELDTATGAEIFRHLRQLQSEQRTTVVVVTHDSRYITPSDRVIRMQDGRLDAEQPV
jgi:polar amino acid transport system ATP-binding protein